MVLQQLNSMNKLCTLYILICFNELPFLFLKKNPLPASTGDLLLVFNDLLNN